MTGTEADAAAAAAAATGEAIAAAGPTFMEQAMNVLAMAKGPASAALDVGLTLLDYIFSYAFYFVLGYVVYTFAMRIKNYVLSLWVQAESNEWLVVTRNGELVQAGIGLSCFRSPFDSVAKFPSTLTKVSVETLQVTREYQGVKVSSMLEWTVDRDGPVKALQNLDLTRGFASANDVLSALTGAVVRNMIANSSIETILKDRDQLREAIMKEITEKSKGWGVHLATCEITDMRIMSASLFENMQTPFREENQKKARLERLVVETELWRKQQTDSITTLKRQQETSLTSKSANWAQALKNAAQTVDATKNQLAVKKKQTQRQRDTRLAEHTRVQQRQEKYYDRQLQSTKDTVAYNIESELANRKVQADRDDRSMQEVKRQVEKQDLEASNDRQQLIEKYELQKTILNCPVQRKLKLLETVQQLYQSCSFSGRTVSTMTGKEPMGELLDNYLKLVEDKEEEALAKSNL